MKFWQKYGIFFLVYIASFASLYVLPASDLIKGFMAFPGSVALLGVLYQLWRDDRAHERELELQSKQQDFALGTASHMATVAYDKHVAFGEEYMERVQSGFQQLMNRGKKRRQKVEQRHGEERCLPPPVRRETRCRHACGATPWPPPRAGNRIAANSKNSRPSR